MHFVLAAAVSEIKKKQKNDETKCSNAQVRQTDFISAFCTVGWFLFLI